MNQRETNLLNNRLRKLSNEIAYENRKPKASRDQVKIIKAKQRMSTIKYWIDPEKEMKRLEPMFRAEQLHLLSEARRNFNPFDQMV